MWPTVASDRETTTTSTTHALFRNSGVRPRNYNNFYNSRPFPTVASDRETTTTSTTHALFRQWRQTEKLQQLLQLTPFSDSGVRPRNYNNFYNSRPFPTVASDRETTTTSTTHALFRQWRQTEKLQQPLQLTPFSDSGVRPRNYNNLYNSRPFPEQSTIGHPLKLTRSLHDLIQQARKEVRRKMEMYIMTSLSQALLQVVTGVHQQIIKQRLKCGGRGVAQWTSGSLNCGGLVLAQWTSGKERVLAQWTSGKEGVLAQ
ncbi:hypothetical protein ACHWQZ_G014556 [Mnemiopsis leidyi]